MGRFGTRGGRYVAWSRFRQVDFLTRFLCTESEEEEEDEDEEEDILDSGHAPDEGLRTPSGLVTPSGLNSVTSTVPGGLATPDFLQLRKDTRAESDVSATPVPRDLYQVIPEKQVSSSGFMGSSTAYDISSINAPGQGARVLGQDDRGTKVCLKASPFSNKY